MVAFIHRESYYNRTEELTDDEKSMAEIIIAKQRNGPTDTVHLRWIGKYTRFDNPAAPSQEM